MTCKSKRNIFLFLFQFSSWLGFTFITRENEEWNWLKNSLISIGWASWMTYVFHQMSKNNQLYLASGQGEGLIQHLISQGYVEQKKKDDTTFFKKPGWSFNPFKYTTVKESAFYTLIVASDRTIKNVPEHLERIRQPYVG